MTNGLTLNICEVIFDKSEVPLPYCEYDEETFSYWRDQPGVFAYRWNDRIYLWQLAQDEGRQFPRTGTSLVTLDEDAPLFVKLIEQSLIAYLNALDYTIYRKKQYNAWDAEIQREESKSFGHLSLQPVLRFAVRALYSTSEKRQIIALSIQKRYKRRFLADEEGLRKELTDTRPLDTDPPLSG